MLDIVYVSPLAIFCIDKVIAGFWLNVFGYVTDFVLVPETISFSDTVNASNFILTPTAVTIGVAELLEEVKTNLNL